MGAYSVKSVRPLTARFRCHRPSPVEPATRNNVPAAWTVRTIAIEGNRLLSWVAREPQLPGQDSPVDDWRQQPLPLQSAVAPGKDWTTLTLGSARRSVRGRPTRWPLGE